MSLARAQQATEIFGTRRRLETLERAEVRQHNLAVVRSGRAAVARGDVTMDNVVEQTKATVTRHVDLMQLLGFVHGANVIPTARPRNNRHDYDSFKVYGKTLKVGAGTTALLAQYSGSGLAGHHRSAGFAQHYAEHGLETTLEAYASPHTTVILTLSRNTGSSQPEVVDGTLLAPNSCHWHSQAFANEWRSGSAMFPFDGDQFEASVHQKPDTPDSPAQLSDKQLVIAAGLLAEFNKQLDIVDWALENYPL